jgi:hypothetical protein
MADDARSGPFPVWIKGSGSYGSGACIELSRIGDCIAVRDSKSLHRPPFLYAPEEMAGLFAAIRCGEFDDLLGGGTA